MQGNFDGSWIHNIRPTCHGVHAEEIREYFMEHLQAKEESTQNGAESALDPEDLATQVC